LSGLSGYATADVRLAWRSSDNWTVELAGRNLLGPAHAEFPASGRQPEVERALDGRVTFQF